MSRDQEKGRVLKIQFKEEASIDIILIPGRVNVLAETSGKVVSALKA